MAMEQVLQTLHQEPSGEVLWWWGGGGGLVVRTLCIDDVIRRGRERRSKQFDYADSSAVLANPSGGARAASQNTLIPWIYVCSGFFRYHSRWNGENVGRRSITPLAKAAFALSGLI